MSRPTVPVLPGRFRLAKGCQDDNMAKKMISYDDLIAAGHNKYALTIAVAKRARQIHDGSLVMVETDATKSVTAALAEILNGRINYGLGVSDEPVEDTPDAEDAEVESEETPDSPDGEESGETNDEVADEEEVSGGK